MAFVQRKIPFVGTPETNPETKPFWDGCAAGKLVLPRCKDTGKYIWYPRAISPFTFGPVEWVEASGRGKIYTLSVMQRADPPVLHRVCGTGRGTAHDDQHRGLRLRLVEDRPGGEAEVHPERGRPTNAVLHTGLSG